MDLDPSIGRAEQDPGSWWAALTAVTQDLVEARAPIVAVSCVGQAPTLVAVDARGEPVRPAITWMDTRVTSEAAALEAAMGVAGWALGVLTAARWVERNDPGRSMA